MSKFNELQSALKQAIDYKIECSKRIYDLVEYIERDWGLAEAKKKAEEYDRQYIKVARPDELDRKNGEFLLTDGGDVVFEGSGAARADIILGMYERGHAEQFPIQLRLRMSDDGFWCYSLPNAEFRVARNAHADSLRPVSDHIFNEIQGQLSRRFWAPAASASPEGTQ